MFSLHCCLPMHHTLEERAAASSVQPGLSGEVSCLGRHLQDAGVRRDGLQREVAGLQCALGMAMHRGEVLQGAREALGLEVAELNQRMVDMRQAQHGIVQRLRERTEMSVDIIERTVAMTGLKLEELLASVCGGGHRPGGP